MSVLWKDCTTARRGDRRLPRADLVGGADRRSRRRSGRRRSAIPTGSAPFPYTSPALFSMTLGLRRHLAVLDPRQQRAGADRPRRLPRAAGAVGDRHRRRAGLRRTERDADGPCPTARDPATETAGPPPPGRADAVRPRAARVRVADGRRGSATPPLRKPFFVDGATDLVTPLPRARRAAASATRWCATATASASSPPPTCATRCCGRSRPRSCRCARSRPSSPGRSRPTTSSSTRCS